MSQPPQAAPERRRPDLFIIGAAKCGTTSMHAYLSGHPEVYMSPRKEPRYFAPDLPSGVEGKNLRHGKDLERYLDLFAEATTEKRLGEASVRYLYSTEAPRLISEFHPRPYIVAMLRDPVEMMVSFHLHRVAGGAEVITDFEQALAAEPERREGKGKGADLPGSQYRARARFGEQLERWIDVYGRERIHVIVLEDFLRGPDAEFQRLLEYLEVDPTYRPPSFNAHNPRHLPRSKLLQAAITSVPAQKLLWRVPGLLGGRRARSLLTPLRKFNRRPAPKQTLRPELRRQLQAELAPDVARLSELLDRDMAEFWWQASQREVAEAGATA